MDNPRPISIDLETWSNQELYEVISSRYFVLGNQSSKIASWEVKGANNKDASESLLMLNAHLHSLGMIGTLSDGIIPILTITSLPPSNDILKKWQQILIWSLMSLFLTIVGSEWLSRYDSSIGVMNLDSMQDSFSIFTVPIILTLLLASYLRSYIASRYNVETGYAIPIIFPILYPIWPFGIAGLLSQKRMDHLPFPNRRKLIIIESIIPLTLILFGSFLTIYGVFLTSNEPPNIAESPIVFTSNLFLKLVSSILFGDMAELRLQWLHPIGISGTGLSIIGWILLLPIPGFPGDRILYSFIGPSKMNSSTQQTSLFLISLILMIFIFATLDYLPWLFLSAFAAWQRFSPENVIDPFIIDKSQELTQIFKTRLVVIIILFGTLGFPGATPLSILEDYDSGLSTEEWVEEIYFESNEEIIIDLNLKPDGILPISGYLQFSIAGSQSELWQINSSCDFVIMCKFNNVTHDKQSHVKIILNPPNIIIEEKLYLKIVVDIHGNEEEHLIMLSNDNYSGPTQVFWDLVQDTDTPLICTKINILSGDYGNLSIISPYWDIINYTSPVTGVNDLCLRGHMGAIISTNYIDEEFRKYGPSIEFSRVNNTSLNWLMPIDNTNPKVMLSGTEWQIPSWFNSDNSNYSILHTPNNPTFCKTSNSITEVDSNWTWLMEPYSPIQFREGEIINGTLIMPISGWLIVCNGINMVMKYSIMEGIDIIMNNGSIGENITNPNFTIYNRGEEIIPISIEWHGDSINTDIWELSIPNFVESNGSTNISIYPKNSDNLHHTSWVQVMDDEIIIHLAARCLTDGCYN